MERIGIQEGTENPTHPPEEENRLEEFDGIFPSLSLNRLFEDECDKRQELAEVINLHIEDLAKKTATINATDNLDYLMEHLATFEPYIYQFQLPKEMDKKIRQLKQAYERLEEESEYNWESDLRYPTLHLEGKARTQVASTKRKIEQLQKCNQNSDRLSDGSIDESFYDAASTQNSSEDNYFPAQTYSGIQSNFST